MGVLLSEESLPLHGGSMKRGYQDFTSRVGRYARVEIARIYIALEFIYFSCKIDLYQLEVRC